jgi:hypothetical protein
VGTISNPGARRPTPPIIEKIVEGMKKFCVDHGVGNPTQIHLSPEDERELEFALPSHVGGDLAQSIIIKGFKATMVEKGGTLYGMKIYWDAKALRFE